MNPFDYIDLDFWLENIPLTLTVLIPTALVTALITWLICRMRGRQFDGYRGGEPEGFETEEMTFQAARRLRLVEEELQTKSEQAKSDAARIQELQQEVISTDKRQEGTVQEVANVKRALSQAMAVQEDLRAERDALAQEVSRLSEGGEGIAVRGPATEGEVAELTEALRESEYRESRLATEIQLLKTVRTEFEALRNDNRDLEEDLDLARQEQADLEAQVRLFITKADEAESDCQQAREDLEKTREALRLCESRVETSAPSVSKLTEPLFSEPSPTEEIADSPKPPEGDPLTKIEGISPGLEEKLNEVGISRYEQIAGWDADDVKSFSELLGFEDRIKRDRWVEQAAAICREADDASEEEPSEEKAADEPQESETETKDSQEKEATDEPAHPSLFGGMDLFSGPPHEEVEEESNPIEKVVEQPTGSDDELLEADLALGVLFRRPPSKIDDLTQVKGIARVLEGKLHELGVFRFKQIAQWNPGNVNAFAKRLSFGDRIEREKWRAQCQELHESNYGERIDLAE